MSILAQIGVVILIVCIVLILIRSNKTLEEVYEEGEHFVDEWDMRQQRKEERALEKKEKKKHKEDRSPSASDDGEMEEDAEAARNVENVRDDVDGASVGADILSMDKYRNPKITLVELDENHRTVRRIPVTRLPFTIGRGKENMLDLDDLCVARKHCRIVERNGVFLLEDVGTANKLYVNGEITEQVALEDQLEVYIGNVELRVEMGIMRSESTRVYDDRGEAYYE